MRNPIRILIADDHTLVRTGLSALIEIEEEMELIGEARDGVEAVEMANALLPDVILMDLIMPRKSGTEAIVEIRRANPQAKILVLTSVIDEEKVIPAIRAGALGYLVKDSSSEELLRVIYEVFKGNLSLPPALIRLLIHGSTTGSQVDTPELHTTLTDRELDVLVLVAKGQTDKEIGSSLSISHTTVRYHVSNILDKLQLENRTQAALYAIRNKLVKL